ncbi:halocarboxylic acid dehydrogenase DehI family protein [Halomarina halobia]|uniref:Halocarboxylic acid dehydrogenase DehI family protein n=1 Tax=Halomarina halobia TaxID=3033386 RepID=A0ABD6AAV8_9EURY|nr:halocarboxylic acid dehydrogenase DehI family protein [Halomarina sp. PSR21]
MDTSEQLYDREATGWRRGLYDDVKHTFRAPVVNWIFRTAVANEPEFTRYAWGQVKPLFETRAFARLTVEYRDAVLSELDDLPAYDPAALGVSPAAFAELRGQLATFDVVAPRLAVLFEAMDRGLHGEAVGTDTADDPATTAPFPDWLDRDRGAPPSMVAPDAVPGELSGTVESVREFHGLGSNLPSIYRCLAQWPAALDRLWGDVEPALESAAFDRACDRVDDLASGFVTGAPYRPRLAPDDLRGIGMEEDSIEDVQELFREFNSGPVETVLPALPVFAATVGAGGERAPL